MASMGETEITQMTALELAAAIRDRAISPSEVMEATLDRIDAVNPTLNAVIWRNDAEALQHAETADQTVVHTPPEELPPFFGVPIPIKDLTEVEGWPITYGSRAVSGKVSIESEPVVEAFQQAGFILTGRTNTPEFGPITVAENLRYGLSRNPWNPQLTPGGSSGGAAAAAAGGMFAVAHGNDGGGSLRIPASCCGLVGLKVSRGRVPSLQMNWEGGSVEGVLTRDVASTAAILDLISGPDMAQWYNAPKPERPFFSELGLPLGPIRIGVVDAAPFGLPVAEECREATRAAASLLERLGHHLRPASLSIPDEVLAAFLQVVNSGLADYDFDLEQTEPHIRASVQAARELDSLSYVRAVHQLQRATRTFIASWGDEYDILLTPTMTIPPPIAGTVLEATHQSASTGAPALEVFQMAAFTAMFNMFGQPAISLPIHVTEGGVPIGVQLVGAPFGEALLLRLAAQLEQASGWTDHFPHL